MSDPQPKVSVVVATYQPGDALNRVVRSLDAQTMPQDAFEVIFVDDGSPDDTYERLEEIAAARSNARLFRIENSGWASRPRNVGIENARGEYLLFMDHDDSLFPDGLQRAYEYASLNNADVLSPKESKTNDSWWALTPQARGNIPNTKVDGGMFGLMPMVPHKLYRRALIIEHGIRFAEGARVLWEDILFNVAAYRHAQVVSILADTPVYLWHATSENSSHSFDPVRQDFWKRLDELMEFISTTLDTPELREAREWLLSHQLGTRVLGRLARMPVRENRRAALAALRHARRLLRKYGSDDVIALLSKKQRAQVHLLRSWRPDRIWAFHAADLRQISRTEAKSLKWADGVLRIGVETIWAPKSADQPTLRRAGDRVVRVVSDDLASAIPQELLDVTDDTHTMKVDICIRTRPGYVAWNVPCVLQEGRYEEDDAGRLRYVAWSEATVDIDGLVFGGPIDDTVWDFKVRATWSGMARKGPLHYQGPARPGLRGRRSGIPYENTNQALSLDLCGRYRTLATDAKPRSGPAGPATAFSVPLDNVAVDGDTVLEANSLVAIPDGVDASDAARLEQLAGEGALHARVVATGGEARLEGSTSLRPGRYLLYARRGEKLHVTKRSIVVSDDDQLAFD